LAFEYQGETHYYNFGIYGDYQKKQETDLHKAQQLKDAGITLITIPFWWDSTDESLIATIQRQRPDIVVSVNSGQPIPEDMPIHIRNKIVSR
jgi:hypothetical protein